LGRLRLGGAWKSQGSAKPQAAAEVAGNTNRLTAGSGFVHFLMAVKAFAEQAMASSTTVTGTRLARNFSDGLEL
jgi:hypothetical protein